MFTRILGWLAAMVLQTVVPPPAAAATVEYVTGPGAAKAGAIITALIHLS